TTPTSVFVSDNLTLDKNIGTPPFPTTVEEFQQLQRSTFDVDYFSVIREEWPQVQQRLEQRVDMLLARTRNE
ncbi:hypothetical protein, partial [Corynebacterium diphtheriae]|uniref:hypothetical protein n=1 Tax=Corynebacterium diphtheriae TaxID=1717 RepID=UPI001C4F3D69